MNQVITQSKMTKKVWNLFTSSFINGI